jgi:hypothetical protein
MLYGATHNSFLSYFKPEVLKLWRYFNLERKKHYQQHSLFLLKRALELG